VVLILAMTIIYRIEHSDESGTAHLVQPFLFLALTAITEQPIFLALLLYRFGMCSYRRHFLVDAYLLSN